MISPALIAVMSGRKASAGTSAITILATLLSITVTSRQSVVRAMPSEKLIAVRLVNAEELVSSGVPIVSASIRSLLLDWIVLGLMG